MAQSTHAGPTPAAPAPAMDGVRRRLPNGLTILRLLLAGAFFVLLSFWPGLRGASISAQSVSSAKLTLTLSAALFIVAALTDALDGYLSRRWNVVSVFGRVMDPFADKVLVVGAFMFLAGPAFLAEIKGQHLQLSGVMPWMAVLVLARELLVTSIRGVVEGRGGNFSASFSGKAKMIVQSAAIPTVLLAIAIFDVGPGSPGRWLIDITVWVTIAVTALSGLPYIHRGIEALRAASGPSGDEA